MADGGIEYALGTGIFPNYSYPLFSTRPPEMTLGDGTFVVDPPTVVADDPLAAGAATVNVDNTSSFFAGPGRIVIDTELIEYTGTTGTSFTLVTRGAGGTTDTDHVRDNSVYPVVTTTAVVNAIVTTIPVLYTAGFLIPGVINVGSEYMFCTGTDATPAFINCTRGYKSVAAGHPLGSNVFQYVITSTATVPTGIIGNAQRIVRVTVGP